MLGALILGICITDYIQKLSLANYKDGKNIIEYVSLFY